MYVEVKRLANEYGLEVVESASPKYKLDVYKNGEYVTSIGAKGYSDYQTYRRTHGEDYAEHRRNLYYQRHKKDIEKGGRGYLSWLLLWN